MIKIIDELKQDIDININIDAKELMEKSKSGDVNAKLLLAKLLIIGEKLKRDTNTANILLNDIKSSLKGEPEYIIGRINLEGLLPNPNNSVGINEIENSSLKGYEKAMLFLGFSAIHGINGLEQNIDIAEKNLRKLANKNNINAKYELGKLFENGLEGKISVDYNEAVRWYEECINNGFHKAYLNLGNIYYRGNNEFNKNVKKAINFYEKYLEKEESKEVLSLISFGYIEISKNILEKIERNEKEERVLKILKNI